MPLWKGTGSQSVWAAAFSFYQTLLQQEDAVVATTQETLENLTHEMLSSSAAASVIAKLLEHAAGSYSRRSITHLEGLDLTPPRLDSGRSMHHDNYSYYGNDVDPTLLSHVPRRSSRKDPTLMSHVPRRSRKWVLATNNDTDDEEDVVVTHSSASHAGPSRRIFANRHAAQQSSTTVTPPSPLHPVPTTTTTFESERLQI